MAKITIEKDGREETIEINDDVVDKLVTVLTEDKKTKQVEKEVKLTTKENKQLSGWYKELNNEKYVCCGIQAYVEPFADEEIKYLLLGEYEEERDDDDSIILEQVSTFSVESDVLESAGMYKFLESREALITKFRDTIRKLAKKYKATDRDIWRAIEVN